MARDGAALRGELAATRGLFIDNEFVRSAAEGARPWAWAWPWAQEQRRLRVVDPFTEDAICTCAAASAADVDRAVAAAHRAFSSGPWGRSSGEERAAVLRRLAAAVTAHTPRLAEIECRDAGKPLREAQWDMEDVAACLEYYAGLAEGLSEEAQAASAAQRVDVGDADYAVRVRYEPCGVVALIVPFNYPLLMAVWKVAPALAAGCTCVLKPSEHTPLSAMELAALAASAEVGLPRGVLNVLPGRGDVAGAALAAHALVAKVGFTGSLPTGRSVMRACAAGVRQVTLELGGKSPALVFDNAGAPALDLESVVEWVMFGCFWTNGQICSATSRLLLQESLAPRFLERLVARTRQIAMGDPLVEGVELGPLVSAAQRDKVRAMIEHAVRVDGATMLCGEAPTPATGYFIPPTVLLAKSPEATIWREEVFGPVLTVLTFREESEAVALANDSEYGLAAAVFTTDPAQMRRVVPALRCGIVWENCSQPCFCQAPWGGHKKSGVGRDLGTFGLHAYLEPKQVCTYLQPSKPLDWYSTAAAPPTHSKL